MARWLPWWLIWLVLFLSASLGGRWLIAPAFDIPQMSGLLFAWAGILLLLAFLLLLDLVRPDKRGPRSVHACLLAAPGLLIGGIASLVDGTPRILLALVGAALFITGWIVDWAAARTEA